jgi:hypothetical protein
LETFKLGYEFVRDELAMRRESLERHAGHEEASREDTSREENSREDNVVMVKSAQSA